MGRGEIVLRIVLGAIIPLSVLLLWHAASSGGSAVIPTVSEVLDVLIHPLRSPPNLDSKPLFDSLLISILRVLTGYTLAVFTAVPLGILMGRFLRIRNFFWPVVEILRPICPIAWLPVAIIVFGFSSFGTLFWEDGAWRHEFASQMQFAMVAVIWWGAFFPILLNTVDGVRGVKVLYIEAARVLGAGEWQVFKRVVLPASLPSIMTGMRVGMGIAWMVIIAAEIFPGTRAGLGYMITTAHQVAEYEYAFACIIVIGVLGFLITYLFRRVSDYVCRWQTRER